MSRFTVILLAASITVLFGAAAIAGTRVVYEWTDAHGEVHYSDQWKPGAKLIRIETADQSSADSAALQGIQSESNAASDQLQKEQDVRAVQQDEAKVRAENCKKDKENYQTLIESRRIFTTDKSGQRQYLSDAQADALRVKARQTMEADCGSGS